MSHIRIDKAKALKKWSPVLENMGVISEERLDWMSELAEYHSINENAYLNAANVAGMGNVVSPQPSLIAGSTIGSNWSGNGGTLGSGDVGQNLLPVSMKIAGQTIGLDLVSVKPSPGPKLDLLYIDFQYDDSPLGDSDERPQVFKLNVTENAALKSLLLSKLAAASIRETVGGLTSRIWTTIDGPDGTTTTEPAGSKANIVEFLGFSRIDGLPMFRTYRQANTASSGTLGANAWAFDATKNTFSASESMIDQMEFVAGLTVSAPTSGDEIQLISALEDHIPGFVSNFTNGGKSPMSRLDDDKTYSGVIGPRVSSKTIAIGTIEVSSALRRTEIEDIKANTGMDIVQKMESILVNELSQTISKQIVNKIFEMGDLNRMSAPLKAGNTVYGITPSTIFDLDTAYVTGGPGGETTHAVQRKLITKIAHASNYIATEGRVGPAQFVVTNGGLAAAFMDIAGYTINPVKSKLNGSGQLYPVGQIGDITIYVDPYMKYNDNRIVLGRKNNPDQPGIIFVPYLMAQSISLLSEATFAPRLLLRSRYAISEVGWYPQKQYMSIVVLDNASYLN